MNYKEYTVRVFDNGDIHWYKPGTSTHHRKGGPAIEFGNGSVHWCIDGSIHREDGPAIIDPDGSKFWYKKGQLNRLDGPAVDRPFDSLKNNEWWIDGKKLSEEEFKKRATKTPSCDGKVVEIDGVKYTLTEVK